MSALLLVVPLAPLAATLVILFLGGKATRLAGWINVGGVAISLLALIGFGGSHPRVETVWMQSGGITFTAGIALDTLSRTMAIVVAVVALIVNWYSVGHMAKATSRFFAAMSFFVAAMLTLVLANSTVLLFAAWEAVGLASFLLIGFHYREDAARQAARKAFLLTRLGDVGLLLGWLLALRVTGSTDIEQFLGVVGAGKIAGATLTLLALLFFAGAVGKSAQLPLTAWLPDAMAGPAPVSALIHSATMVAAGVYLVLRFFPLFVAAPGALTVVLWTGAATALFAALVATTERDLKRVLAWSTASQLGEMMFALGLAGPLAAAFHLATHATFKSTLFLAAGAVDHATGTRRLDQLGGLARRLPITACVFTAAALALAGVWPLSGFWSEDKILASAAARGPMFALYFVGLIFLAGVYVSRAATAVFAKWPRSKEPDAHEPGTSVKGAMIALAVLAIGSGFALSFFLESAFPFPHGPELSWIWKIGSVLAALAGLAFGGWRVRAVGPVPAFGLNFSHLATPLDTVTLAPATLAMFVARALDSIEQTLDRFARTLAQGTLSLSRAGDRFESGLDQLARATADSTMSAARGVGSAESHGFSDLLDAFARLFGQAGGRVRGWETGKLYLYTFGLFIWTLLAALAGFFYWR